MEKKKKVIIIGAGPGGLSAGMLLANRGYEVVTYEKKPYIGGRNGSLKLGEYTFDIGPTFFMMKDVLEEIFQFTGRKLEDYVELRELDPMYRLHFSEDKVFYPTTNREKMIKEIERVFPGHSTGYDRYLKKEQKKYNKLVPCLQIPYDNVFDFVKFRFIGALPYLDAHTSLYTRLNRFFKQEDLCLSFTFQAKYIGMSPWQAPGTFSIISFIEHGGGIFHVMGGLNQLSVQMGKIIEEDGGTIHLNRGVKRILVDGKTVVGVELEDGSRERADYVVVNADFAHAMTHLVDERYRKKYSNSKLAKKLYSCSTFMLYLGVNRQYDIPHHNIIFSDDYRGNVREISETLELSENPSFYIQNASVIDPSLAPAGKSAIYVLVPIANNVSGIDWEKEKQRYRDKLIGLLETKGGLPDLSKHIEEERIITPTDWEEEMDVYNGATFNLGHNIGQMLIFRPHNRFEELKNCYLVGGGTHPGSGLPTIYESGRISSQMIMKRDGIKLVRD